MPKFTGKRQTRWYQAQSTCAAIEHFMATGDWPSEHWTLQKALRLTQDITGQRFSAMYLHSACNALQFYMDREMAEFEAQQSSWSLIKWLNAWRNA